MILASSLLSKYLKKRTIKKKRKRKSSKNRNRKSKTRTTGKKIFLKEIWAEVLCQKLKRARNQEIKQKINKRIWQILPNLEDKTNCSKMQTILMGINFMYGISQSQPKTSMCSNFLLTPSRNRRIGKSPSEKKWMNIYRINSIRACKDRTRN